MDVCAYEAFLYNFTGARSKLNGRVPIKAGIFRKL